ncbi:MAG: hypothetical protein ACHQM6_04115 [Candidatus Kapaibacterium sp.]
MATTNNSYTDLIHLFIDGEATETERNTLFNALKDSPELQEEFSSSMDLKKAFATDIMNLQPPSYLESQIAERAGILVAASAAAANAPVVVSAVSSAVSNVAPMATGLLSKGVLMMIVGTSVGILSTIGVIKLTSNNSSTNTVAPQAMIRQAEPVRTAPQSFTPANQLAPMNTAEATLAEKPAAPAAVKSEKVNQNSNQNIKENTPQNVMPVNSPAVAEDKNTSLVHKDNSPATEIVKKDEPTIAMISAATPLVPTMNAIGGGESKRGLMHTEDMIDIGPAGTGRLSARLTGIMTAKLYQGQNSISTPIWNNIGLGLKYDLDASNAIGIEAGQEKFPLFLANSQKGGFDDHQSITWVGASWTYSAIHLEVLGIHPEVRALVAESNAGPIGKFSTGLVFPFSARISFSTDAEYTMLPIKSNGAYLTGNKLALTAAFTFHF